MKTLEGWFASDANTLDDYLRVGDVVDEEMVQYFVDLLPPATFTSRCVQIGEPNDHTDDGHALYGTFEVLGGNWTWQGNKVKRQGWTA